MTEPQQPPVDVFRAGELSLVQLAEQHAAGFEGYAVPVQADPQGLADRIRTDDVDLWNSFGLRSEGRVVALVLVARRGGRARVASMGVPAAARRQGWGRRSLQVAIDEARLREETLQLEVLTSNTGAVELYRAMGFETRRTLLGWDSDVAGFTAGPGSLEQVPVSEVADAVAMHAPGLPWQLEPASLHALGSGWRGWRCGPSLAVARQRDETLFLLGLVTPGEHRRRGHASRLLAALATEHPEVRQVRVISLVPAGMADGFFTAAGFTRAPLSQYEMHLR